MKNFREISRKIGVKLAIIAAILAVVFLIPIPFVQPLWDAEIGRHRMRWALYVQLQGQHRDEIIQKLGEPQPQITDWFPDRILEYTLVPADGWWDRLTTHRWRRLIIFLDENGIAVNVISANPRHV